MNPHSENRFRARFRAGRAAQPLVIAHRGDSFHAPENTLEAARLAWDAGADAWEFDVRLTRDGVPILIHDESLGRTTDVARRFAGDVRGARGWRVADFTASEIATLDAGSWFVAEGEPGVGRSAVGFGTTDELEPAARAFYASGAVQVPSLIAALELTNRLVWLANVELKTVPSAGPGLLDAVLAAIAATGTEDRVLISSFDHAELAHATRLRPAIPTGVLTTHPIERPEVFVRDLLMADSYHPSTAVVATWRAADFETLAAHGVPTLVYTVNDRAPDGLAVRLADAGAAGLFTDDPRGLRTLFGP